MASNSSPDTATKTDNTLSTMISTAAKALETSLNRNATKTHNPPGLAKLIIKIKHLAVVRQPCSERGEIAFRDGAEKFDGGEGR
ncbi:hypothetical protein E2P81_ATG04478 [Venturia nashicola]|nr:hypothetical protein E2P81_ATG04478 [Venturia nashicola]